MSDNKSEPAASRSGDKTTNGWKLPVGGLILALLTAILTGAVSYAYGVVNDIRKAKLDFVNLQIEKLYGPLYASSQAADSIWILFSKRQWRDMDAQDDSRTFFDDNNPPTVAQVRRWRHWMRTVFQPLNLRMEEAIVSNSHLLIGDAVPPAFRQLIAHVEAYKAVIANWKAEDFEDCQQGAESRRIGRVCEAVTSLRNTAVGLGFPDKIMQCIADDYLNLKRQQQELQGGLLTAFFAPRVIESSACSE